MKYTKGLSLLLLMILLSTTFFIAYAAGGRIEGKVTDPRGAAIPAATVTITNQTTKQDFTTVTDGQGNFVLRPADPKTAGMPAGKYLVSITTTYVEGGVPDYEQPPPERVPYKYRKGIEFDVPEGGTLDANFDLVSK